MTGGPTIRDKSDSPKTVMQADRLCNLPELSTSDLKKVPYVCKTDFYLDKHVSVT